MYLSVVVKIFQLRVKRHFIKRFGPLADAVGDVGGGHGNRALGQEELVAVFEQCADKRRCAPTPLAAAATVPKTCDFDAIDAYAFRQTAAYLPGKASGSDCFATVGGNVP